MESRDGKRRPRKDIQSARPVPGQESSRPEDPTDVPKRRNPIGGVRSYTNWYLGRDAERAYDEIDPNDPRPTAAEERARLEKEIRAADKRIYNLKGLGYTGLAVVVGGYGVASCQDWVERDEVPVDEQYIVGPSVAGGDMQECAPQKSAFFSERLCPTRDGEPFYLSTTGDGEPGGDLVSLTGPYDVNNKAGVWDGTIGGPNNPTILPLVSDDETKECRLELNTTNQIGVFQARTDC